MERKYFYIDNGVIRYCEDYQFAKKDDIKYEFSEIRKGVFYENMTNILYHSVYVIDSESIRLVGYYPYNENPINYCAKYAKYTGEFLDHEYETDFIDKNIDVNNLADETE